MRPNLCEESNFTVLDDAPEEPTAKFRDLLLGMSYADFRVRRLLDLEGLKQWLPGRMEGYQALEGAVRPFGTIETFLLSVMGEGTFLTLLRFLERHAPDPVTRSVTHLAANDEARHVAFGVAHLRESAKQDASLLTGWRCPFTGAMTRCGMRLG